MNGVDRLPKHVREQNDAVPASAHWVKRVSPPPPRFLLVVLLSAQILFLAILRLGFSTSIWGSSTASPPQALFYSASSSVGRDAGPARPNKELRAEGDGALSSSLDVTTSPSQLESSSSSTLSLSSLPPALSSPSSSSSAYKKKSSARKKLSSKLKVALNKPLKSKQKKALLSHGESSVVHSVTQQESPTEAVNVAAQRADHTMPAVVDSVDDLLPSIDDKLLAEPASKGASSISVEAKVDGSGTRSSSLDSLLPILDKQSGPKQAILQPGELLLKVTTGKGKSFSNDDHVEEAAQEAPKLLEPLGEFSAEIPQEEGTKFSSEQIEKQDNVKKEEDRTQEEAIPAQLGGEKAKSFNNRDHVEEAAQEQPKFSEPLGEFSAEILQDEGTKISSKTEEQIGQVEKEDNVRKEEDRTEEGAIPAQLGGVVLVEVTDGRVTKSGKDEHLKGVKSGVGAEETQMQQEQALSAEKVSETSKVDVEQKKEQANGPQKETEPLPLNKSEKVDDHHSSLPLQLPLNELNIEEETGTSSQCKYGYIYVYDLPPAFNRDIISNCSALNPWVDVCSPLLNGGLGVSLGEASPLGQVGSWFISNQFMAEVVFHNRILQHPCLTDKVEDASGFYVPFYPGLDVGRFLWLDKSAERRDRVSNQLLQWLAEQPTWQASGGWNHFMMVGRITWDFRRSKDEDWGSGFFYKPAARNMTKLLIERNPWDGQEMAVPYPTNFHPQSDLDMVVWQNHIRSVKRNTLFSFAGAPRKRFSDDFRGILFEQCEQAQGCHSLDCSDQTCDNNQKTLELFLNSTFCLQPRGDSFTRRSTFDCLLAGSIPVFFWHRSAYLQYKWHLPADEGSYSVFISRDEVRNGTKIEDVLRALPPEKVQAMQEAVVRLVLPRVVYAASGFSLKEEKDAFDVAIEGVMRKFKGTSMRLER